MKITAAPLSRSSDGFAPERVAPLRAFRRTSPCPVQASTGLYPYRPKEKLTDRYILPILRSQPMSAWRSLPRSQTEHPLNRWEGFERYKKRLARPQRAMSRKKKFSSNGKKMKARLQRVSTDIANTREDYLQKTTTPLCKNHAIMCIEDVRIQNMCRSAQGTLETPAGM